MGPETCIACGSSRFSIAPTSSDKFRLRQCQECGTACTDPLPSLQELEQHYSQSYYGQENVKFVSTLEKLVGWITQRRASWMIKKIKAHSRILEIGCGRGILLNALSQLGHECHGTERSALAATRAKRIVGIKIYTAPLGECHLQENSFDLVILWHVLEHLEQPADTLMRANRLMKAGGTLILEVPNFSSCQSRISGKHWFHSDIERHLYHFTTSGLSRLLALAGFQVDETSTFSWEQCPFGVLQSLLNCLGFRPNALYLLLKKESALPFHMKLVHCLLAGLFLMPSILFAGLEASLGKGGVIRITARK